jgi:hypothetical protein
MFGIAFDFGRSAFVRFDEHTTRIAGKRQCRSIKKRPPRNELFGLTNIGNDGLQGLPRASTDTGQRDRCAHQL